jgi:kinesin family member 2/24
MPQAFIMDKYILDNVSRFHAMVGKYKPPAARKASEEASSNADMMVIARLRPLLPDEANAGYPSSVIVRPNKPGIVDVHELRQPVRGPAQLKVHPKTRGLRCSGMITANSSV